MKCSYLANANYGNATQASYSYKMLRPGQRPLLQIVDAAQAWVSAPRIKYEFWQNEYLSGSI